MGVAGANTGGNTLGGRYANLDPRTAEAVVKMAAFLASMLSIVHQATGSTAVPMQDAGIEIPFGDLIFQVSGALDGFDTEMTSASGARARIRQISIVLSLGVARSSTGLNRGVTVQEQGAPAAAGPVLALDSSVSAARQAEINSELAAIGAAETDAAVDSINTGDADAANQDNLVIICQRINADDVDCLAPPPPPPPPDPVPSTTAPATTAPGTTTTDPAVAGAARPSADPTPVETPSATTPGQPQGLVTPTPETPSTTGLPSTGSDLQALLVGASGLVILGAFLVLVRRRRAVL